ncbi:MAG: adenylate kinase [Rhodothermales bacterium]
MRIVFLGPPGIGKGTQAALLAKRRGLTHTSTGTIIRAAIEAETPLGEEAKKYVQEGHLVPDRLVRVLAETAIAERDYDQFVLDGYPRTIVQAEWLSEFLETHGAPLDSAINLEVPTDVIVDRLSKRRVHRITGENFHLDFKPPPADVDPGLILQRTDDRPEYIRKRLEVYRKETRPVEEYYETRGILRNVEGVGDVEDVYSRIEEVLPATTVEKKPS